MEAVLLIGIQATGKSSFYKYKFADTHIRLNLDMLKTRHRETILLKACLEAKQPFVIDNTNPTILDRQKYIEVAKEAQFTVVGYYFQSILEDALKRNQKRIGNARIPAPGIKHTYAKLQLPTRQEGFDKLFYVQAVDNGQFIVEEWEPS
jgi:predicted kinase